MGILVGEVSGVCQLCTLGLEAYTCAGSVSARAQTANTSEHTWEACNMEAGVTELVTSQTQLIVLYTPEVTSERTPDDPGWEREAAPGNAAASSQDSVLHTLLLASSQGDLGQ